MGGFGQAGSSRVIYLTKLWKLATSRPALALGLLAALYLLASEGCQHREDAKVEARVYIPGPTQRIVEWRDRIIECSDGSKVVTKQPTRKQAEKLAPDYGLSPTDLLPSQTADLGEVALPVQPERSPVLEAPARFRILGEVTLSRLPWGGTGLGLLDQAGAFEFRVAPNPEPLFEAPNRWTLYGKGAMRFEESGGDRLSGWAAGVGLELAALRYGRWNLGAYGEAGYREATGSYAEAGAKLSRDLN